MSSTTDPSSLPGTTPSVADLSAEFAKQKRPKSPPLAFEKTSNDSLVPLLSPRSQASPGDGAGTLSPLMGRLSPPRWGEQPDLQVVVDQQAAAIQLLHDAFAAERQAWSLEKDRLYHRIVSLEKLLRTGDGHSPARSPVLSPLTSGNIASPSSRAAAHTQRLPSIAEDEPTLSLSQRREGAPASIEIPSSNHKTRKEAAVQFEQDTPTVIIDDEFSVSLPEGGELSPPPMINRMEAGHTPLRAPRPLTPPPINSLTIDGIDDTPTRDNTQMNAILSRSNDDDEDKSLTGPLHMPELPNQPDASNFTFDMLNKRLEHIEKNRSESAPAIFSDPSPGLASPTRSPENGEVKNAQQETRTDSPLPRSSRSTRSASAQASSASDLTRSPSATLSSPNKKPIQEEDEDKVQSDFETGGIKLRKKPSTNFGAPFGQLGGFGRRASQDQS